MTELKKLDRSELQKELMKAQKNLMQLRFESRTGKLSAPHKLRLQKLIIARVSTLLSLPENKVVAKKKVVAEKKVKVTTKKTVTKVASKSKKASK